MWIKRSYLSWILGRWGIWIHTRLTQHLPSCLICSLSLVFWWPISSKLGVWNKDILIFSVTTSGDHRSASINCDSCRPPPCRFFPLDHTCGCFFSCCLNSFDVRSVLFICRVINVRSMLLILIDVKIYFLSKVTY